jgi:Dolichyl-phosphate-mannose-protein mannosyltransferase
VTRVPRVWWVGPTTAPVVVGAANPVGVAVVGVVAFAARYALTGAIENDHFVTFARAVQLLYGDWPVRNFEDPGFPLSYLLSTVVAALFGPSLFVNVLLCVLLLAITSALTYLLTVRATASQTIAAVAAALTVIVYPRLYNATKVIVPVVAMWLAWRYAEAPRPRRLFALALWTAVAFLLRHDYLVYVALGNIVLLAACHGRVPRDAALWLASYGTLVVLLCLPWLLYVQRYEGLSAYVASAVQFTAAEGRRTATGAVPSLFLAFLSIPVVGAIASFKRGMYLSRGQLASAAVMLASLDVVFLRDVLAARIPDVIAPTAVVAAATVAHVLPPTAVKRGAAIVAVVAVLGAAIPMATRVTPPRPADAVRRIGDVTRRLRRVSPDIIPTPSLAPLIGYLTHCTATDDRILVTGFGPEIPVLAHRPFAARLPTWIPGYYEDRTDVDRALAQLQRERLGAAVFLDGTTVVARSWPALLQAVQARGFEEYSIGLVGPRPRIWLPHFAATTRDPATGLPCPAR